MGNNKSNSEKETVYLTQKEVKDLLKVTLTTLWRWRKTGVLKAYGIGARVYFKKHEVEQALITLN